MNDRFMNFMGITKKAGKCLQGYNKCEDGIKKNRCHLVILSLDVSQNTKDKFKRMCELKNIPIIVGYTSEELGAGLGREKLSVIGISDIEMSKNLIKLWEENFQNSSGGE